MTTTGMMVAEHFGLDESKFHPIDSFFPTFKIHEIVVVRGSLVCIGDAEVKVYWELAVPPPYGQHDRWADIEYFLRQGKIAQGGMLLISLIMNEPHQRYDFTDPAQVQEFFSLPVLYSNE